jgi:hypothetical protein
LSDKTVVHIELSGTLNEQPAELHSVFVSFLSPCFGCRRRCPAQ